jgi:hypothetical protein
MARTTPTVWLAWWGRETRAEVQLPDGPGGAIQLDSAAWQEWLERPTTTSFAYPIYDGRVGYIRGFMTVRKERRRRGSQYWVAYQRVAGRLHKLYLGRSGRLTQSQLEGVAGRFLAMADAQPPVVGDEPESWGRKEVIARLTCGVSLSGETTR